MVRVGIVGISGFSGRALLDILLRHKEVRVTYVAAHSTTGMVAIHGCSDGDSQAKL